MEEKKVPLQYKKKWAICAIASAVPRVSLRVCRGFGHGCGLLDSPDEKGAEEVVYVFENNGHTVLPSLASTSSSPSSKLGRPALPFCELSIRTKKRRISVAALDIGLNSEETAALTFALLPSSSPEDNSNPRVLLERASQFYLAQHNHDVGC